jgi:hypothetical protein
MNKPEMSMTSVNADTGRDSTSDNLLQRAAEPAIKEGRRQIGMLRNRRQSWQQHKCLNQKEPTHSLTIGGGYRRAAAERCESQAGPAII